MPHLIIERGRDAGKRISLTSFPIIFGREKSSTIFLKDEDVSSHHAQIKQRGRLFILQDLDSKNGTYLNGERVLNAIIKSGDKILIGQNEFRFVTQLTSIQFTSELENYDQQIIKDLGIKSHNEDDEENYDNLEITRLENVKHLQDYENDAVFNKNLMEFVSSLQLVFQLEQAAMILFKSIKSLVPDLSRSALFTWRSSSNVIKPKLTHHFSETNKKFFIGKKIIEEVINRKQGVWIKTKDIRNSNEKIPTRIVLPMFYDEEPICILHFEIDKPKENINAQILHKIQQLIGGAAASFEAMILKSELDIWVVGMMETLVATIEAKDTYTHGHSERVAKYCLAIAEQLKLDRQTKKILLASALCHDIGKIGVHDAILKKATMLSAEEYEEMKLHPTIGAEIVSHLPNSSRFISGVKYHHEKWDGTGYPEGLCGDEIPFFARIVGIADVFDAMVSGRSYSGFLDESDAVEKLTNEKELFDPDIYKAFLKAYQFGSLNVRTNTKNNKLRSKK
ncbi:MAG: HD domain-containing protein [Oligoflexales bacterium]|nr:HD domain-containing protein [Oligoflexales bacterium]